MMKPCPLCLTDGDDDLYVGSDPPYGLAGCRRCGLEVSVLRGDVDKPSIQPAMDEAKRRWDYLPRAHVGYFDRDRPPRSWPELYEFLRKHPRVLQDHPGHGRRELQFEGASPMTGALQFGVADNPAEAYALSVALADNLRYRPDGFGYNLGGDTRANFTYVTDEDRR